jgi:hypothetical protein
MRNFIIAFLVFFFIPIMNAQQSLQLEKAKKYLELNGEVSFAFKAESISQFLKLNEDIYITGHVTDPKKLEIEAYANPYQFEKFLAYNLEFTTIDSDNEIQFDDNETRQSDTWDVTWNVYPKYSEYVAKLASWATKYPDLFSYESIGTTPKGREIYVLKISDNVEKEEDEAEFFYSSSMHGDEITGYPIMLHFIDSLLNHYTTNPDFKSIIDNTELYISPLANPDGSYRNTGNDVMNSSNTNKATRSNSFGYDLNRNYPDQVYGIHPDKTLQQNAKYQVETLAFLKFQEKRNFVLGANYHGGAQVVNFPWDSRPTAGDKNIHPHDDYFKFITKNYAQSCQALDPNYMSDSFDDNFPGTTNGSAWYIVAGGRQDYSNVFNQNKEITVEVSETKFVNSSTLPNFFRLNFSAMIDYVKQANYGLHGKVTDKYNNGLNAKVYVADYDKLASWVATVGPSGSYHKVMAEGKYKVIFEVPGYETETRDVTIKNFETTIMDVVLVPTKSASIITNQETCSGNSLTLSTSENSMVKWYDSESSQTPILTNQKFTTPNLSQSKSYFYEEEIIPDAIEPNFVAGSMLSNGIVAKRYLVFNTQSPIKLETVSISTSSAGGEILIELQDEEGEMIQSKLILLPNAGVQELKLGFFIPKADAYRLVLKEIANTNINVRTTDITYPISNTRLTIIENNGTGIFLPFFNWTFGKETTNRKEVKINVNTTPIPEGMATQQYCIGDKLASLTVIGENITWYDAPSAGNILPLNTTLTNSSKYYASQKINDCESNRFEVLAVESICSNTNNQNEQNEALLFPNPSQDVVYFSTENISSAEVFNAKGQSILYQKNNLKNGIDVSKFPIGIYFVKMKLSNKKIFYAKFVKT